MTTLKREAIQIIKEKLEEYFGHIVDCSEFADDYTATADSIYDALLSLRGFSFLKTDEESPVYHTEPKEPKRGSEEWKALKRAELEKANPALAILTGGSVSQEALDASVRRNEALDAFERDMRFNPLPWYSEMAWEKMADFVAEEYEKDNLIFAKYKTWQQGDGKYHAISNRKIRQNPREFIDCFPDFLTSVALKSTPLTSIGQNNLQFDEDGRLISY